MLELLGAAHADDQARAARADDAHGASRVDVVGCQRQRIEHGEMLAAVQLAPDWRTLLANGDAPLVARPAHLDIHDAGLGFLPQPLERAAPARQHEVRGDGRVPDESGFHARREEPDAHVVIVAVALQDEGGVGIVELARDGEHLRVG